MKIQIRYEFSDSEVAALIRKATMLGFKKANERRAWSKKDKKEAVNYACRAIVAANLGLFLVQPLKD